MLKKLLQGFLVGLISAAFAVALWLGGWLNWIESASWDFRVRIMAKPGAATENICIIALDQYSLDFARERFGTAASWPWFRELYAPIVDFCTRAQAKALIFDAFFTEPSRGGVSDDQAFGNSIASNKTFVVALPQGYTTKWPAEIPKSKATIAGIELYLAGRSTGSLFMPKAAFSVPEISTNVAYIGHAIGNPDADGKVRRISPFLIFDKQIVPSLGLSALLAANGINNIEIKNNSLRAGPSVIPLDASGKTILNFRGKADRYKIYNAAAVLNSELRMRENTKPEINPSVFKNKYVFFGFTAPALFDLKATPISEVYPGVAVHATTLDNILSGDLISDARTGTTILLAVVLGLAAGLIGRLCSNGTQSTAAFVLLTPLPFIFGFAAYSKHLWLPIGLQEVSILLALVSTVILNYATEGRQKRFIKSAFKQYLSSDVIEKLVKDPCHLKLGGENRELSIFFSDVGGFTGISEVLTPELLTALLNEYLTAMTNIIYSEGGTIDKYEGDAIIAFWNAPLDLPGHTKSAVRAALRCNRKLAELRPVLKQKYGKDLFARIGINTGPVVVGNMGSTQRFNYTFLGDAGNLASRLEGLNKQFNTSIMISEFTFRLLGEEIATREISCVRVVGRKIPIRVYEPMFAEEFKTKENIMAGFARALQMYYEGRFKESLTVFSELSLSDGPSSAYVRRCTDLIENPPKNWDGVWEMKEK